MSKKDRLKAEIGLLEVVFVALFAADVSSIGWAATHEPSAPAWLWLLATTTSVAVSVLLVAVMRRAYRCIAELEKV